MKITRISAYQVDLPVVGKEYRMAMGKVVTSLQTTVIRLDTDTGLSGYGEACPLGSNYLPAYAKGIVPGVQELAPHLLGEDPLNPGQINHLMDGHLNGHAYVKSPIDVACWDLLGKHAGLPVCQLLGGRYQARLSMYFSLSCASVGDMLAATKQARESGYKQFQIKLAGSVDEDIARVRAICQTRETGEIYIADANQGFTQHQAVRFVSGLKDVDVYIEQPCETLNSCLAVRQLSSHPFKLDESIHSIDSLLEALCRRAMDVACIKISKIGGLTKAKLLRDICAAQGIAMTVEDSWGSDIVTASLAHLAASTPAAVMLNTTNLNAYMVGSIAKGAPIARDGYLHVSDKPGLGIEPDWSVLNEPILECA